MPPQYAATRISIQESDEPRCGVPALCDSSMTLPRIRRDIASSSVSCLVPAGPTPVMADMPLPLFEFDGLHEPDVVVAGVVHGVGDLPRLESSRQVADRRFDA